VEQPQLVRRGRPAGMRDPSDALADEYDCAAASDDVRARRRPGSPARGYFPGVGQDRRQAEAAACCVDRAEGLVLSCFLVRPYVRCHRVTVRGSSGARGDRSAEGTYVARGIDSAHSEVVRGMP
jgi:hypothetical protein